jgi:hypothetical protein
MVGVEGKGGGGVVSMMEVKSNKCFAIVYFVQLSVEFELTLTISIVSRVMFI